MIQVTQTLLLTQLGGIKSHDIPRSELCHPPQRIDEFQFKSLLTFYFCDNNTPMFRVIRLSERSPRINCSMSEYYVRSLNQQNTFKLTCVLTVK